MTRGFLFAALALSSMLFASAPQAAADGMRVRVRPHHHWHHRYFRLLPERHVVEVNRPTFSGNYIINGTDFTAATPRCAHWAAGERIKLLAGDWNGVCTTAVFYNFRRRQSCEMWCR